MSDDTYRVQLENIFEGPMDLLLYLIRKNEVDIADIPIATITEQYLAHLNWMQAMNIDLAGDFLLMAATLAHIKSRMLLPNADAESGDAEDPRVEIVKPLQEYLRIKSAAEELCRRDILGERTFVRPPSAAQPHSQADAELVHLGLFELIDAFQRVLNRLAPEQRVTLTADRISVKDRITEIIDVLEEKGSITFDELFAPDSHRAEIIVTFLAILEMVKLSLVHAMQHTPSGIIRIHYR
jgi:segregation and condensation protein A